MQTSEAMMQASLSHGDARREAPSYGDGATGHNGSGDGVSGGNGAPNTLQLYWDDHDPDLSVTDSRNHVHYTHTSGHDSGHNPYATSTRSMAAYSSAQHWEHQHQTSSSSYPHDSLVYTSDSYRLYNPQHANANVGLGADSGLTAGLGGSMQLGMRDSRQDSSSLDLKENMSLLASLPIGGDSNQHSNSNNDSYEDSTDSDLPPEKRKLSAAFRPRGKKKRNKCTAEQLRSLEAFFEKNRNPTGRIRLELSRRLRMPERSVQVWFQNRRAKVKTLERRGEDVGGDPKRRGDSTGRSSRAGDRDAGESTGTGRSGNGEGQENSTPSVTAFPTSALCVGTWRRVSPLICFFSRRLQSMTWYLTSESIGFKLEIPWTSIRTAYFDGPWSPSIAERAEGVRVPLGHFVIDLERPPTFFMEVFRSSPSKDGKDGEQKTCWRQCEDFTEHRQATSVNRHILNGPYEELREAVLALARSNTELEKMIVFRDEPGRASGKIPCGTSSTAENFGLVNASERSPGTFASSLQSLQPEGSPLGPFDANLSLSAPPNASISFGHDHDLGGQPAMSVWHTFRSPSVKMDASFEFDSPASMTTNLSETSFESGHRVPLGHPGSWKDGLGSIDTNPRSSLGSSMDLNALRIDTAGISSFGSSSMSAIEASSNSLQGYPHPSYAHQAASYDIVQQHGGNPHYRMDSWESTTSFESASSMQGSGYALPGDAAYVGNTNFNQGVHGNAGQSGRGNSGADSLEHLPLDPFPAQDAGSRPAGASRGQSLGLYADSEAHSLQPNASDGNEPTVEGSAGPRGGFGEEQIAGDLRAAQPRRLIALDEDMYVGETPTVRTRFNNGNESGQAAQPHSDGRTPNARLTTFGLGTGHGVQAMSQIHPELAVPSSVDPSAADRDYEGANSRRHLSETDNGNGDEDGGYGGPANHGRGRANTFRQHDYRPRSSEQLGASANNSDGRTGSGTDHEDGGSSGSVSRRSEHPTSPTSSSKQLTTGTSTTQRSVFGDVNTSADADKDDTHRNSEQTRAPVAKDVVDEET
ncbi:hypothetical protein BCV70DRAFT_125881 [Testicularia cyperi]|uniref:Homeobox domain-containing protein n=1 Tax=Testicularia cyperi TaxID=1882483 RepID=A0A317XN00_9BASI|nr:hypothetical protein BCV70DRAFT_125881 [Testicularia cyperi]